jgi:hypothetical protein
MFLAFAAIAALSGPPSPLDHDPVFTLAKRLVGTWEGILGKRMKIRFTFRLQNGGQLIIADGVVGVGTPKPMFAHATLGWDPIAKKVYYLDQHGTDTIYFGHVTREGDDLVFDFNALSGDTGHYRSRSHLSASKYEDSMKAEKNGKWVDMGFHLAMHRVSP